MSFLYKYLPLCNDIDWTRKIPRDYGEAEKKQTGPGGDGEGNKGIRNAADGEMGKESERSIGIGNAGN